jgi:hypothetical protein
MKTRNIVAALVIAAVAAGGAFIGVRKSEENTERTVREFLADAGIGAETVEYRFWGGTLTIGKLTYAFTALDSKYEGSVDSMVLEGFNVDSLKAGQAGSALLPVADSFLASGLRYSSAKEIEMYGGTRTMKGNGSADEIRIGNWRRNLGTLAALYRQEGLSESFFRENYRYYAGSWSIKNYRVSGVLPGDEVHMEFGEMGWPEPLGSLDGDDLAGRTVSFFFSDGKFTVGHTDEPIVIMALDRLELRDLLCPSPAGMAGFLRFVKEAGADRDLRPEELMDALRGEYSADKPPYSSLLLQGLTQHRLVSHRVRPFIGPPAMSLEELKHTMGAGAPFTLGLSLKGLNLDPDARAPAAEMKVVRAFAPQGALLDASLDLSLLPGAQGLSKVEISGGVRHLGTVRGSGEMLLAVDSLEDLLNADNLPYAIALDNLSLSYADSGLLSMVLALEAMSSGRDVDSVRRQALSQLELAVTATVPGDLGTSLQKALAVMLDKPGTLALAGRFGGKTDLAMLLMQAFLDPASLDITVTAEPGPQDLLEYLPESLR